VRSLLKVALALGLGSILAGCSALRLAYESADTYLLHRANSYLDLDEKSADELDERIDEFFGWHRKNALPQYARISEEAAKRIGDGLSREDLAWGYDSLVSHARQSLRFGAERIAPVLDRMAPQQVAHMEKQFAEDNRKFAREYLRGSETDRRKRRAKRLEQRLEDWVGNLSAVQVEKLKQFSQRAPLYDELRDRDRKRMQQELLEMVRSRQAQKRLPDWVANWERGRDPAHLAASERFRREYYELLLDLDKTLTAEQRAHAQANLRRYAEDFKALARRAGAD
jgi:hypothetical protein